MNNFIKSICIVIFTIFFLQCTKEYKLPEDLIVQDFIWKGLNAYYLYQDQVEDLSDKRFNSDKELNAYLNNFTDNNQLFTSLLIPSDVKSNLIEDYTTITKPQLRSSFTNGIEFTVFKEQDSDTILAVALDILPMSYAEKQKISRGDYFLSVVDTAKDTIALTIDNFKDLLINYTQDTLKLVKVDYDGINITETNEVVELVKKDYTHPAINLQKVIAQGGNNIGYLLYNNDFSKNYIDDLNTASLDFKNQSVDQLVLDLRYNIGGGSFAKNIANLATIFTGQFTNEVLIKEKWNTKAQSWFEANQPDSLLTKFPEKLNADVFNHLKLKDIYIVLNGLNFSGSSAIELLINSLNPYINVHLIGAKTSGNNNGSIILYNSEDYNVEFKNNTHTIALQPIVLNFYNKNDETYENGFTPTISLCANEDVVNLGVLGERSDPILDSVLEYISSGELDTKKLCNENNFVFLYNSIDIQREPDYGILLEQNLPNTYK